jgi:hypothetical protein
VFVHHAAPWPFERLVAAFTKGRPPLDLVERNGLRFAHAEDREAFRQFHNERAELVVVTHEEHMRLHRSEYDLSDLLGD